VQLYIIDKSVIKNPMALVDIVKYESNHEEFIHKYPSEDIKLGSQLIVDVSQTAFFVKGGEILDQFKSGTHTLSTENIPILNRLINLPFGSQSPFQAEVWFVNLVSRLDLKWGTTTPIQLEDPKYGIIVPIRAFGQYGIKIKDARLFFESLVGNMETFTAERINEYFKGKLLSSLTTIISNKLIKDQISILEINSLLEDLSQFSQERINQTFLHYGIELVNFYFVSINIPETDPSVVKLKEAKDLAAKLKILGRDVYQMDRSFGVLDKAAENDSGISSSLMGAGIGLGIGAGIGNNMGGISSNLNVNPFPPNPNSGIFNSPYYFLINGQQIGPIKDEEIKALVGRKSINLETYAWKAGMANWEKIQNISELINLYFNSPPPLPPQI
jgi:membrane protease subunit (stomatin/prohibitin family)